MELADEDKYDFDPLDVTKIWPEDQFPLQPVGRMVLNKNADNFFSENEQLAFSPSVVVPGPFSEPFSECTDESTLCCERVPAHLSAAEARRVRIALELVERMRL